MKCNSVWMLAAVLGSTAVGSAGAEVILVNNVVQDVCYVLDPSTGDVLNTFPTDFSTKGVNIIDGFGANLLMCDAEADTIWELNSDGSLRGAFNDEPINAPNGIDILRDVNVVAVATSDGLFVLNRRGERLTRFLEGQFCDEFFEEERGLCHVSNVDRDNLQAYNSDFTLVGETGPGLTNGPAQINPVVDNQGVMYCGVAAFLDNEIQYFDLSNGDLVSSFPVDGRAHGLIQMTSGNLLVTTSTGLDEYTVDGTFVRTIESGQGFAYLEFSFKYSDQ